MKYLPAFIFAAVVASACSSSPSTPPLTPSQESVSTYLKKTLDDPASYAPVRWGQEDPITRADSVAFAVLAMTKSADRNVRNQAYALSDRSGKDNTTIGTTLVHVFRAKNKLGGVVLDSARFVVAKTGSVSVLP